MSESLAPSEPPRADLAEALRTWEATPPPSLSEALQGSDIPIESLEDYARSGIPAEESERLRRVLVHGATSGRTEDAGLLARLTPLLDPRQRAWDRVSRARETGEVLTAMVTEAVKGGVVVDLGVRGFVPSSQIGLNIPRNLTQYIGRELRLRVKEVDRKKQTVILSNREVVEEERAAKRKAAIERLEEGETRTGAVRRITEIGAFVDVGGVDGLLHVSEISWNRIEKPSDVLEVGQKVEVKVLKVLPDQGRVSLSMRRLVPDPWEEARRVYQVGGTAKLKVARTVSAGAIVELEGGLEGFIPISELAPRRVQVVEEVVQPGDEVEAVVIDVVQRDRRVVFSLRKLQHQRERAEIDSYEKQVRTAARSERTTLGDLFGHLFQELTPAAPEPEPEPVAAPAPPSEPEAAVAAAPEAAPAPEVEPETEGTGEAAEPDAPPAREEPVEEPAPDAAAEPAAS